MNERRKNMGNMPINIITARAVTRNTMTDDICLGDGLWLPAVDYDFVVTAGYCRS